MAADICLQVTDEPMSPLKTEQCLVLASPGLCSLAVVHLPKATPWGLTEPLSACLCLALTAH